MTVDASGSLWIEGADFPDHNCADAREAREAGNLDFYEQDEQLNKHFINDFSIPLLERLYGDSDKHTLKILSVGCGVGIDVDILIGLSYDAWGTDCGSRCLFWEKRSFPERLIRCTDDNLPFPDSFFDFVMCHQVLEHIGVVGDSIVTQPGYKSIRQKFLNNLLRVTKPGGRINVATPNRLFPIDPGHGPNCMGVRVHGPFDYFLTSYSDMRKYCVGHAVKALSPARYYAGTYTSTRPTLGAYFNKYLTFLDRHSLFQGTFLNPLTNALITKSLY
jgi:SAM-dependent methyltransferase